MLRERTWWNHSFSPIGKYNVLCLFNWVDSRFTKFGLKVLLAVACLYSEKLFIESYADLFSGHRKTLLQNVNALVYSKNGSWIQTFNLHKVIVTTFEHWQMKLDNLIDCGEMFLFGWWIIWIASVHVRQIIRSVPEKARVGPSLLLWSSVLLWSGAKLSLLHDVTGTRVLFAVEHKCT